MSLLKTLFLYCVLLPFTEASKIGKIPPRCQTFEEQQTELSQRLMRRNRSVRPTKMLRGRSRG